MHLRQGVVLALGIAVSAALSLAAAPAEAGCNLIAVATKELPSRDPSGGTSVTGFVDRAVAGPGDTVTVRADRACGRPNPGFAAPGDPNPNQVTLRFTPPDGPTTDVSVPAASVRPIKCAGGECGALQFEVNPLQFQFFLLEVNGFCSGVAVNMLRLAHAHDRPLGIQIFIHQDFGDFIDGFALFLGPLQIFIEHVSMGRAGPVDATER